MAQLDTKKSLIDALASDMETEAHKKNTYPGVMRELFSSIGWTR